jgi:hypothetical protein
VILNIKFSLTKGAKYQNNVAVGTFYQQAKSERIIYQITLEAVRSFQSANIQIEKFSL